MAFYGHPREVKTLKTYKIILEKTFRFDLRKDKVANIMVSFVRMICRYLKYARYNLSRQSNPFESSDRYG